MPDLKKPRCGKQPLSAPLQEQLLQQIKQPGGPRAVSERSGLHVATVRSAAVGDLLHPATVEVLTAYLNKPVKDEPSELATLLEIKETVKGMRALLDTVIAEIAATRRAA